MIYREPAKRDESYEEEMKAAAKCLADFMKACMEMSARQGMFAMHLERLNN